MSILESHGVPTVMLCTTQFAYEAQEQWRALGFRSSQVVEVRHPFGHLSRGEVTEEVIRALPDVVRVLTTIRQER
jgi:hypothetical protein